MRRRFRAWRGGRPFWGGVLTMLAGVEILWMPLAPLNVVVVQGIAGVASLVIATLLIAMGGLSWFQPHLHSVLGVVAVVLSLASFLTSNLGGCLFGMMLGIVGGSLVFAWTPQAARAPTAADVPDTTAAPSLAGAATTAGLPDPARVPSPAGLPSPVGLPSLVDGPTVDLPSPAELPAPAEVRGHSVEADAGRGHAGGSTIALAIGPVVALALAATSLGIAGRADADPPLNVVTAVSPSSLSAFSVKMSGLAYRGIVEVRTRDGLVRTLRFTMDSLSISGLELTATFSDGNEVTLRNPQDRTTLTSDIELYTTRFSGLLGGVIPVVFTPSSPPPLILPELTFTLVKVKIQYLRAGSAHLPSLRETAT
jgi:hypothetical protein